MSYCIFVYATRYYEGNTCIYGVRDMNSSSWPKPDIAVVVVLVDDADEIVTYADNNGPDR